MLKFNEMKQAASWPQVTGEVTAVRLLKSNKQYQPELDVSYVVEEKPFVSHQRPVSNSGQTKGSKKWAREFSLKFKPGTAVSIYYDPKRPKRVTLNPSQIQSNPTRWQFSSGLMIVLSIGMHIIGSRALIATYLNLSSSTVVVIITTVVTLLLGTALALLIQDTR
ncbi:MAG: DUF3592 domain-containing protein [Chloroflexi bacterium]|nr:DUF3592 domain-containing protein [Chloroflexota bacterium]